MERCSRNERWHIRKKCKEWNINIRMDMMNEQKKELRKKIKQKIEMLTPEYCQKADEDIFRKLISMEEYKNARTVFCYVGTEKEINTFPILEDALNTGKRLGVPLCTSYGIMEAREITNLNQLKAGAYGILEPGEDCPVIEPIEIDVACVPCLTCDKTGRRLGYGGGFYDRYLPKVTGTKVVLCRSRLMEEEIPSEEFDVQMDYVITDHIPVVMNLKFQIKKETALRLADCREDNPMYPEMEGLYEEILSEIGTSVHPKVMIGFATDAELANSNVENCEKDQKSILRLDSSQKLEGEIQKGQTQEERTQEEQKQEAAAQKEYGIVLCTLGEEISQYIDGLFTKGEYLKAVLADAMADSALFTIEEQWKPILLKKCENRRAGIRKRLEMSVDYPAEYQKRIWELLGGERYGIRITSGYMFSPVKTCSYLFELCMDMEMKCINHDCAKCGKENCLLRKRKTIRAEN